MSIPKIVAGSNFGDECKGLIVDSLCATLKNPLVVKFNGGAQCGHTVTLQDGRRHVFHHIGSGTFVGAPTYLSEYFIVNPTAFILEMAELKELGETPTVYVNPHCLLTTPYDMIINWAVETKRGTNRHGSCGYGINETVHRNESIIPEKYQTRMADLLDEDRLIEKLKLIRDEYLPNRLDELGCSIRGLDPNELADDVIDTYMSHCAIFVDNTIWSGDQIIHNFDVVFEGAQGLLLDQNHKWFPHVTRSNTGIQNATKILSGIGIHQAEVFYVTRPYLTRHGAGPLPHEVEGIIYPGIVDETNHPNQFQETIRYAPIDFKLLANTITGDLENHNGVMVDPKLVVTCLNQLPDVVQYVDDGEVKDCSKEALIHEFNRYPDAYGSSSICGRDLVPLYELV